MERSFAREKDAPLVLPRLKDFLLDKVGVRLAQLVHKALVQVPVDPREAVLLVDIVQAPVDPREAVLLLDIVQVMADPVVLQNLLGRPKYGDDKTKVVIHLMLTYPMTGRYHLSSLIWVKWILQCVTEDTHSVGHLMQNL